MLINSLKIQIELSRIIIISVFTKELFLSVHTARVKGKSINVNCKWLENCTRLEYCRFGSFGDCSEGKISVTFGEFSGRFGTLSEGSEG